MRTHVYKKTLGKRNRTRHVINAEREVLHVAKGDTVKVVRGDDKGKEGKIIRVYPKTGRVLIEGINIVKKHRKARTAEEQSGIIEMPAPVHASNVMLKDPKSGAPTRVRARIDEEISIGDYVLTNGTLAAAVVIDALARFIPGVLGEEKSLTHESFARKLLDFPQYTRPAEFRGMSVPGVLLSGNHAEIEKWRVARQMEKTRKVRPDLLN